MKPRFQVRTGHTSQRIAGESLNLERHGAPAEFSVTLLTGGSDKPYVHGLSQALGSVGMKLDVIGSDELDEPALRNMPTVTFLNLRRDQRPDAKFIAKISRILAYYCRLIRYAAASKPRIFHILWNNRFETFDRTVLMLYYKLLGKAVVLTAHNVNGAKRDHRDTSLNRLTLRVQYRLADHVFVHTPKMKTAIVKEFGVSSDRVTVIPFGINNSIPATSLSSRQAKESLGLQEIQKTILFFGRIKPYKGVEYLIKAFQRLALHHQEYRLIIAGKLEEGCETYWHSIQREIQGYVDTGRIRLRIEFIPDSDTELYFKAADVLVLPYREIFQSGVIFLGYHFGLPVLAADVGSLKDDVVEGATGFTFRTEDPADLATAIERYFASDLFADLGNQRKKIQEFAAKHHSWDTVSEATVKVYSVLFRRAEPVGVRNSQSKTSSPSAEISE